MLQHCERLIQQLQISVLEEEQKLAVAVQVDRGKDKAILQLQDAWIRLVQHWKELEEQRHSLTSRLHSERKEHQRQESEMMQVNLIDCWSLKFCIKYKNVTQAILKYLLIVAAEYNLIEFINTQYCCNYRRAHTGQIML